MALLNIKTVLLSPVVMNIVAQQSFNAFSKVIASGHEWLEFCHLSYEQCSWLYWHLQIPWVACEHAAYRPPSTPGLVLVDPREISCDAF